MTVGGHQDLAQKNAVEVQTEPTLIVFLCSWCGYTGVDQAGAGGLAYPANVRIVQVPCAGRVDPLFVMKCLQRGADGVLVVGCPPGRCHHNSGNLYARRRLAVLQSLLEHVGVERGRIHTCWVGAAHGAKFAQAVSQALASIRELGPAKALVKQPMWGESADQTRSQILSDEQVPEGEVK